MKTIYTSLLLALFVCGVSLAQGSDDRSLRRERTADEHFAASGQVLIRTFVDHKFIGIVFYSNQDGGRRVRHLFRVWSENPLPSLAILSSNSSLEYRGNELAVFTSDGQMILFTLSDVASTSLAIPPGMQAVRVGAYGISHQVRVQAGASHRGTVNSACDDVSCINDLDYYDQSEDGTAGSCDSGGIGSNSCSISDNGTSCSVGCMSGYYACCKHDSMVPPVNQNCKCIKY